MNLPNPVLDSTILVMVLTWLVNAVVAALAVVAVDGLLDGNEVEHTNIAARADIGEVVLAVPLLDSPL